MIGPIAMVIIPPLSPGWGERYNVCTLPRSPCGLPRTVTMLYCKQKNITMYGSESWVWQKAYKKSKCRRDASVKKNDWCKIE
jgi:hypothetical protein